MVSKEDLDLKDDLFDEDSGEDSTEGSDNSAPPKSEAADAPKDGKRVDDLMSKWQTEQARANRLERELQAAKAGKSAGSKEEPAGGDTSTVDEFTEFVREDARRRIFEAHPELAEAGLDLSAISGSTLGEMKASAARQKTVIDAMASRLRSKVLQEHGLDPEVVGGSREPVEDMSAWSDEKFEKFLADRDAHKYG